MYGEETLREVAENSKVLTDFLRAKLPFAVEYKGTVKSDEEARAMVVGANSDPDCGGIIVWCHTFSPSKMWIVALGLLQKPYLHLHTQINRSIPNDAIDMDYMNLHQSAHGDREHGFLTERLRMPREIVSGYYQDEKVIKSIGDWQRAAVGVSESKSLKVARFGDNMRNVAVTEGDKIEAQIKLGWQVNTFPVGQLVEEMGNVTKQEIQTKMAEYSSLYTMKDEDTGAVAYQAIEEIALKKILDQEGCKAFSNTFEDLYGMRQLPGLATQNLMRQGYGYGGEGDWKVSALTRIAKVMSDAPSTFMEDYTYDYDAGLVLGSHMLEVCPSIAEDKPRIEVHPLGIGGKEPPARLSFTGKSGAATATCLIDMGQYFRLICADVECVPPINTYPHLPVARTMWKPMPNLEEGAAAWIRAGGAHHTVLSYGVTADMWRMFSRIMGIQFVSIGKNTDLYPLEKELELGDLLWTLKR
jgi:L-arabinose isomerase